MVDFGESAAAINDELVELRHEFHAHPELAFEEAWTSQRVLTELGKLDGLEIRHGVAGTGIVALLNSHRDGPCVALRADMDALPIQEDNPAIDYASQQPGKMHACGHDGHTTCLIGAARVLCAAASELPGKVKFIFQPAEESGGGGARMVDDEGVLEDPHVDAAFALHGWPSIPTGQVMVGSGPVLAGTLPFDMTIRGKGCHAAYPHFGNDAVVATAHVIAALQTVSSRWNPLDPILVSICHVNGGHTYNVLPDEVHLQGTVRALKPESHDAAVAKVRHIAAATAEAFGCTVDFVPEFSYPVLVNDPRCAELVASVARDILGAEAVNTRPDPGMGGEDFAFFARRCPSAWFRIGVWDAGMPASPALHTPNYNFSDRAIRYGVQILAETTRRYLTNPPR
jgi:amidohydrolase